jgi:hypothetical protein
MSQRVRFWVMIAAVLAGVVGGIVKQRSRQQPASDQFDGLRLKMISAFGDRFEFVDGTRESNGFLQPFWLATIRARRDGEFLLRCHLTSMVPPAGSLAATVTYHLVIGKVGASRVLIKSPFRLGASPPIACVGDLLVVPVPIEPDHPVINFEMPKELTAEETAYFLSWEGQSSRYRALGPEDLGILDLDNQAQDNLKPVSASVKRLDSDPQKSSALHSCNLVFEAVASGKVMLIITLGKPTVAGRQKSGSHSSRVVPNGLPEGMAEVNDESSVSQLLEITPKDQPIKVPVSDWVWESKKRRLIGGKMNDGIQRFFAEPNVMTVRVGDVVGLNWIGHAAESPEPPWQKPSIIVRKEPFRAPDRLFGFMPIGP